MPQTDPLAQEAHKLQPTRTTRAGPEGPRPSSGIYRRTEDEATVYADAPCPNGNEIDIRIAEGLRPPNAPAYRPAAPSPETGAQSSDAGAN